MCQPPSDEAVRTMLGPVLSADVTIEKVEPVLSVRPLRVYDVLLSSGRALHLVLPPVSMWRPLRSENGMLSSEAAAVRWTREAITKQQAIANKHKEQPSASSTLPLISTIPVLPLLPTLIQHSQETHHSSPSFAVYEPVRGTPLALLSPAPPPAAQQAVDHQLGVLFRSLATLTSPTGRFGPLAAVISTSTSQSTHQHRHHHHPTPLERTAVGAAAAAAAAASAASATTISTAGQLPKVLVEGGLSATGGAGTWSVAFHSMLEGVLRDGEDMAVVMSYATIRRHFRRLGYLLDEVTTARLVVVEAGGRGNVLVVGDEQDERRGGEPGTGGGGEEGDGVEVVEEQGKGKGKEKGKGEAGVEKEEVETVTDGEAKSSPPPRPTEPDTQPHQSLKLTGLRDWSSAIFGDPLLATVFSDPHQQPPSTAFLEGFNGETPDPDGDAKPRHLPTNLAYPLSKSVIEDVDTAWIRLLLYQAYHAVTRIVGEFYRPRQDSSARELEARRKLNEVLARLAEVPDDAKKKHQRPEGEMSPAKRVKGAEDW